MACFCWWRKNDRKMRIEVGYGLEGTLTDLHTKLIIENDMVPAFRAGNFSGGISKAVDDMVMVLEGNPEELEARGKRNPAGSRQHSVDPIVIAVPHPVGDDVLRRPGDGLPAADLRHQAVAGRV